MSSFLLIFDTNGYRERHLYAHTSPRKISKGLYSYLADAQNFLLADLLAGGQAFQRRGGVPVLVPSLVLI
jgi:hypothetical protein